MGKHTTAHDVAAALREELRARTQYISDRKIQALLYLAQGVSYAAADRALFGEPITATSISVETDMATRTPGAPLSDGALNIVAVTAARYGALATMDLEALIRGQGVWREARNSGSRIDTEAMRKLIRAQDDDPEGVTIGLPRSYRSKLHGADAERHPGRQPTTDDPAEIAAFAAEMRSRM